MIAPSPYGRPARDPVSRRLAPAKLPAAPTAALDRELLRRFALAGRVSLCELMDGLRPAWAWESYHRLLEAGLIDEHPADRRVALTPAGREESGRG